MGVISTNRKSVEHVKKKYEEFILKYKMPWVFT